MTSESPRGKGEYLESCEERFGDLARDIGYCDLCPLREGFLAYMGEEDPVNVPPSYVQEGELARAGCKRAQQIRNGEQPTAAVDPRDCLMSTAQAC